MDERLKPLFTPWKIGNVEIKNRIVMTSMGGTDLFGWMEVNHFDRAGAKFLMEVAKNNAGLVLPGCQPVYNPMFGQWLHKNKKMYDDLAKWMPEFHKTGAKLFVQLTAGFGRSFTVSEMMETSMSKVREMVSSDTVIGQPITTPDGVTLVPVSRLSFGFSCGGSDFGKQADGKNFAGGTAAGVKVDPVAFLVVKDGVTRVMPVAIPAMGTADRIIEMVPQVLDRVENFIDKKKETADF